MNKQKAKKLAKIISHSDFQLMFELAKKEIKDWTIPSNVNKGLSKGKAWNLLYPMSFKSESFFKSHDTGNLAKINMIREFGDHIEHLYELDEKKNKKRI